MQILALKLLLFSFFEEDKPFCHHSKTKKTQCMKINKKVSCFTKWKLSKMGSI